MKAALADDVGKHVEEILGYIHHTVKVDPSGGLLCVQQVASMPASSILNQVFKPLQFFSSLMPYLD